MIDPYGGLGSRNIVNDHARHLLESCRIPSSLSSFFLIFLNYPINGNFNYFLCKNVKFSPWDF
jgi:hypothetical protein